MGAVNCCSQQQKSAHSNFPNFPVTESIGYPAYVPVAPTQNSQINQTKSSVAILQQSQQQDVRNQDYPSSAYAAEISMSELPRLSPSAQEVISKMSRLTDDLNGLPGTSLHPYFIPQKNVYYVGQWKTGRPNGKGKVYFPTGAYFEGEFINGVAECEDGIYVYPDGTYYRGNIRSSAPNGIGRLVYRNNEMIYDGAWVNHKPHGNGVERFKDGSQYSGSFENGLKHGQGVFRWADGTTFTGNFVNGNIEGQGVQTLSNGDSYEGEFKKSRRWGDGIMSTKLGKYSGQFHNDKKNGQGLYEWSALKRIYRGAFSKGKIAGRGQLFLENGQVIRGTWQNGSNTKISNIRQA